MPGIYYEEQAVLTETGHAPSMCCDYSHACLSSEEMCL